MDRDIRLAQLGAKDNRGCLRAHEDKTQVRVFYMT
jgi:hypothetical protein